jgi:integrase
MIKKQKRATSDEPIFLDEQLYGELETLINKLQWKYKTNSEVFIQRDRALLAFLFLSGCRISEALNLKRKQFRIYPERIEVANIATLKHGLLRSKVSLPKIGALAKISYIFQTWLIQVPEDGDVYVFARGTNSGFKWDEPLKRKRAYQIVAQSGKFPHWARAVCAMIYGRKVFKNDAWKLKQFMGWKRLGSSESYVQGNWEENEKEIYKL